MTQKTNGMQADNCKNIETKKATRRAASKNTAEVDALRKLATAMIGTTLQWPNGTQYRLASFEKVTKNKVTFWLSEPPCHHGVSVMDISRTMLEHLQATGEHRTDCGTTVTVNREAEKPLAYIAYSRGVAQDIFTDWGEAVADLSRHVYNTLRDCCGGEVSKESESRYQVYFKEADEWEVCEVSPIDLNRPQDREAYEAQRERLGLPALEQAWEITIKAEEEWRPATAKDYREGNKFEDEIRIGDRVYSRNYETMGTVVGRYWWNGDNCYRVRMDRECEGGFGRKFIVTSFHRDGLTKNIGNDGREIIGNAEYYRETLFASWWGFNGEPRTFSFGGQQIDIYEKDGQEWEVVSHHQNGEPTRDTMTTGEVCEWLSRLYSKSQEPSLETSSEIRAYKKGDRVERIGTGATGTIDDVNNYEGKRTYIVKYDETQRRQSDGFEYLTEEVFENEIEPAPFFIAGTKYRCIKSVKGDFTKGKVYEQSSDPTQWYGYFRNDRGVHHVWPQPAQIDHCCELYDMKPEDIDPRNYFEPVEE